MELQVWEKVAGEDTAEKTVPYKRWNLSGTRMLRESICSFNLINKKEDRFPLVPESEAYLLTSKPTHSLQRQGCRYDQFEDGRLCAQLVKSGKLSRSN